MSIRWIGCNGDAVRSGPVIVQEWFHRPSPRLDFPLARPIVEVQRSAIERDHLGYSPGANPKLAEALARFAGRRLHWTVDPSQLTVVPDGIIGLLGLARLLAGPGGSVAFSTPAYPNLISPATGRVRRTGRRR